MSSTHSDVRRNAYQGPSAEWRKLIASRDLCVEKILALEAEVRQIDERLEKNPPPDNVCVGVWVRKASRKEARDRP